LGSSSGNNENHRIKEMKRMIETKVDLGHSMKIIHPEARQAGTVESPFFSLTKDFSSALGIYNVKLNSYNPYDCGENKKVFALNFITYFLLLMSMAEGFATENSNFSSTYILISPQLVFELKKSEVTSFEFRWSPALKFNFHGNLAPAESGFQDD
jgi:hypothetical protein